MDDKKAKLEFLKTYLNHILVVIVGVSGGAFGMISKGKDGLLTNLGFVAVVIAMIVYAIIAVNAHRIIGEMEK